MKRLRLAIPGLLVALLPALCHAQPAMRLMSAPPPGVLTPSPKLWWIGFTGGINFNEHSGTFLPPKCSECSFTDGSGQGIFAGIQLENRFSRTFGVAVKIIYDDKRAMYKNTYRNNNTMVIDQSTQGYTYIPADLERTTNVYLSYLVINPMLEIFPLKNLYLMAGTGIGFKIDVSYDLKDKFVDQGLLFWESGTNEVALVTKGSDSSDVPGPSSMRLDLRVGVGYNLRLSESVILAPEAIYDLPLTAIAGDKSWKAGTIHLGAVLKVYLF
jgi:hypothetical protein